MFKRVDEWYLIAEGLPNQRLGFVGDLFLGRVITEIMRINKRQQPTSNKQITNGKWLNINGKQPSSVVTNLVEWTNSSYIKQDQNPEGKAVHWQQHLAKTKDSQHLPRYAVQSYAPERFFNFIAIVVELVLQSLLDGGPRVTIMLQHLYQQIQRTR